MVPFKKSNSSNLTQFQALIAVAIGFSGLVISVILGYPLNLNIYGLLSGVLWAVANALSLVAITNLGLSKAVPLMGSLVVAVSFLWGALFFHELPGGIAIGLMGTLLIALGVILVGTTGSTKSQNLKKGLATGVLAGIIWGSQLVPVKLSGLATADFFFALCLGIFLTGILIAGFLGGLKFKKEGLEAGLLSGVIWNFGNLSSLFALSVLGLSKAGPVCQLAILIAVAWGLFYFKEAAAPKEKRQILIGAAVLFSGVITLGFA